ncbi:uncharacterized protein J4E78_007663 [Alternaria triticimaculans]|uniref:uncharacterized protein n=1 Tax=Alternaria triticimaculans TaxID=297637 RepID=UPI0020C45F49|nr:uncharacterized protein J4E78_007663 [Alternaria triticimaculans]KAI4652836.1 hypothetical protein J4E78_007663 [Alternaria triticimaculans]
MGDPSESCSFEDLIRSKPFTFYIGKEKKAFVVHSKAVAATSWHFHALVNNGMVQSQERSVEYPDMEPDDFARFVEYSYRYDYTAPSWTLDEGAVKKDDFDEAAYNDEVPPADDWEVSPDGEPEVVLCGEEVSDSDFNQATRRLRQRFRQREYLMSQEPKTIMLERFLPPENSAPEQDFTPIFLAHARLYTFACMRLIDPLKRLALHKLHQTLLKFKLYDRRVGDVVELARYAYDNGEDRKPDGSIEDLRKLVVEYIACEVSTIGKHEAFAPLLQEGGEFVVDFWRIIAKENLSL